MGFALPGRDAFAAGGFVFGGTLFVFRRNAFCLSAGRFLPFGGMFLAFRRDAFAAGVFARRGSIPSCEGHFPSSRSSPPATQITVGCGDVFRYWRGDGCCGIGYETLCRSIPILHNFFQSLTYSHQVTRNPNLSSLPSSAATTIPNISR